MALETGTFISDLVATNPTASDPKSQGDDHLRLVKSTVKATFPNITGAVTPTHTELNYVAGATSALQTQMNLKAPKDTATFTGNTTLPATTVIGTVTSQEITYLSGVTSSIQTQVNARASLSSPAFTGTPTAPTASAGTATTQLATTEFVASAAFSAALPAQTGNAGKFVTTNGTTANWAFAGISQVTTATTATTLTGTPTLLQITPTSYGVTVTLPDATTCSVGGPLHCIDNRGAYPVRVVNTSGTLLGFVFAGVVSYIGLDDNSTAAGVWAISNNELVGASAQLLTKNLSYNLISVDIGSSRELILGGNTATTACYGVVYDKSTNTFGSVTLIRTASLWQVNSTAAVLSAANQVLVVSCALGATAFEAVTLTISGTTITVNTAATATLSANISAFADGCGLIAVGSSFVTSYTVTTPAAQIRALSISGTTVTIGATYTLLGTAGGLIAASGNVVIAVSTATTNLYTTPFTVSGSTVTVGTGTTTTSGTMTAHKLAPLGTRWAVIFNNTTGGFASLDGGVISLSGTTTTISRVNLFTNVSVIQDAIVVGSNKVLVHSDGGNGFDKNILTDTSGTASAGTAINTGSNSGSFVYVSGTDVIVNDGNGTSLQRVSIIDCSGASPVRVSTQQISTTQYNAAFPASNAVLSRSPDGIYGTTFAQQVSPNINPTSSSQSLVIRNGVASTRIGPLPKISGTNYRGKAASEIWITDGATVIQKRECIA